GLLPSDRLARHRVHEWLFFEQSMHLPYLATTRYLAHVVPDSRVAAELLAFLRTRGRLALSKLERRLSSGDAAGWLANGACSIADLALYPYTRMSHRGGVALDEFPAIRGWLARIEGRSDFVPLADD